MAKPFWVRKIFLLVIVCKVQEGNKICIQTTVDIFLNKITFIRKILEIIWEFFPLLLQYLIDSFFPYSQEEKILSPLWRWFYLWWFTEVLCAHSTYLFLASEKIRSKILMICLVIYLSLWVSLCHFVYLKYFGEVTQCFQNLLWTHCGSAHLVTYHFQQLCHWTPWKNDVVPFPNSSFSGAFNLFF